MIKHDEFWRFDSEQIGKKVLENKEAFVIYFEIGGSYMAVDKTIKGKEYTFSGLYHRSTSGDFKRCKKAFEKYSPESMKMIQEMARG